jgi:hypothetical protein
MNAGDVPYSNTDQRALSVSVRGSGGQWWNFITAAYEQPAALDLTKHRKDLAADPLCPALQSAVIPAAAVADPEAVLVESLSGVNQLTPTQCYWVSSAAVPISSARGAVLRFV